MSRGRGRVPRLHPDCQAGHHLWVFLSTPGWLRCRRSECQIYAVCPFCHGCVPRGVLVQLCQEHVFQAMQLVAEGGDYPACSETQVDLQEPVEYEQSTLW
jgi:hypothetical protein